ncbi:MAG: glycosyltransferase [Rhodopila sp.]|nr:glycosyltransferase [Rhodopila sp.]
MTQQTAPTEHADPDLSVAVIIPFYQRCSGLLLAAVRSALAQQAVTLSVIVVDDSSPLSAREELAALSEQERRRVTVIEQRNAGPGAARNRGLAALPHDTGIVAFLDSDDQWVPDHLANARAAMRAGADFYFSDYVPLGYQSSTFEQCNLTTAAGHALETGQQLYIYTHKVFDALLLKSPVGTSTVVYRRSIGADIRFRTDFSYGEDVFFWMELSQRARMIVFSTRCEAIYGAGVNIAASAVWGTARNLHRNYYDFALHQAIKQTFQLTPEQARWNDAWMNEVARSFVASLLHLLRRRVTIDWSIVRRFVGARPKILLEIVTMLVTAKWRQNRKP